MTPGAYIGQVAAGGTGLAEQENLSPVAAAEERLLSGLRTWEGVSYAELGALGLTSDHPEVIALTTEGLLAPGADRLTPTAAGRLVLNWLTSRLALA